MGGVNFTGIYMLCNFNLTVDREGVYCVCLRNALWSDTNRPPNFCPQNIVGDT